MHKGSILRLCYCIYLPLDSQTQNDDSLSGTIIGGIIGGVIVGAFVFTLIVILLIIGTLWFRKHSKQTKGVYSNLLLYFVAI